MDVVYAVKRSQYNAELRFSLRSLRLLPHDRVWLVGYRPEWLRSSVNLIPTEQGPSKYANTTLAMKAACEHREVSSDFIYMNDDFFIMEPIESVPLYHRGPVDGVIDSYRNKGIFSDYLKGMIETQELLRALFAEEWPTDAGYVPAPRSTRTSFNSYELHIPMVVNKAMMLEALFRASRVESPVVPQILHKRTWYANYWGLGGEQVQDVKVFDRNGRFDFPIPFVSTEESIFKRGEVGRHIRRTFCEPGEHEFKSDPWMPPPEPSS